jgi:hypothetical protein
VTEETDVRIRGLRIHVRQTGEGQPLVVLNGVGAHTGIRAPLESALPGMA